MPITVEDIQNDSIYLESKETLAQRIDFAWSIYCTHKSAELKKKALQFLIYAFDIRAVTNIHDQLQTLMTDRQRQQNKNPDYIPSKVPRFIPFHPYQSTTLDEQEHHRLIAKAIDKKELLTINAKSKKSDLEEKTLLFDAVQRAKYRVHIHQGLFKKDRDLFSTVDMRAHGKRHYAAFTLNINGELSVFNHIMMNDGIGHSSMNAGNSVVCAGELQIIDGKLRAIFTYSGHYRPSLFNLYRLLEYFTEHGVDISETSVLTFQNPAEVIHTNSSYISANQFYKTRAVEIYKEIHNILNDTLRNDLPASDHLVFDKFLNTVFDCKDKIISSDLTKERGALAASFATQMDAFKQGMQECISPSRLRLKIIELESIIANYQRLNEQLSQKYNKAEFSGRFAARLNLFQAQVNKLKDYEPLQSAEQYQEQLKTIY